MYANASLCFRITQKLRYIKQYTKQASILWQADFLNIVRRLLIFWRKSPML